MNIQPISRNSFLTGDALTVPGPAVTLVANAMQEVKFWRIFEGKRATAGQTAVEYMLTTMTLVVAFSAMYGVISNALKSLFRAAAIKILTSYM